MYLGSFKDFKSHPNLVLLSSESDDYAFLRSQMAELTTGESLSIHELEWVKSIAGTTLEIRLSQRDRITQRGLTSFEWKITADLWEESLEKIDALRSESHPRHQYFECHPADDAIIMMSIGEYDDSWWNRLVGFSEDCINGS